MLLVRLLIVFILLLSAKSAVAAQILNVEIPDENLAKCLKKQLTAKNIKVAEVLTEIKCHGKNIKQLAGLEKFSNLTSISLFNNKLTAVDLTPFRHLTFLNVSNNRLISAKIAGLDKLETLYLFKNKLTHIDFSGLNKVKKIRITNNLLNNIDISPLTSLEKGYFFDNKLEDLIVRNLPNLSFIELRQNPMPDEVYDRYDAIDGITIVHDGNADDWK